jgi:predicted transcriptional regulator
LAFTTDNWNTPQTVTVTGVNDGAVDGDISHAITLAVIDGQSDDTYDPVSNVVVTNTTTDNDSAGFTVTQSGGSTLVAESGSTDTFTVVLTAQPASDVVISVTSGDTGEATVDKSTLTFTNGNWAAAQTVTVTGIDDDLDDGNWQLGITLAVVDGSSADAFDNVANQSVGVVNSDNDTAGFTIAHTDGATVVTEDATSDIFTLVLNAQPASDVVLSVSSSDTGEVTTGSGTVTFTNGNWNTAQNVTLTGVNDDVDDGNVNSTMTIAVVDASSSNEFDNVADQTFTVANTDNDDAAFTVTPSATTVTEGSTVTITVVLQTSPNTNVMIDISSGDTSELTISTVTVTFTAGNWSITQTITLTAVDDTDQDGTQNVTLTTAVNDAASDSAYDPLANQTVEFAVTDNDIVVDVDPDYDSDGIYNWLEQPGCALLPDCDFDGVLDPDELDGCVTDPDCDDDLISDGDEIYACQLTPDCDMDGVNDIDERTSACIQDPSCRLEDLDRDGDGIYDKDELKQCVLNPDCDGDGVGDKGELPACLLTPDCDMDGVGDALEQPGCIQDPLCGRARIDTDGDGLTDSFEYSIAERCVTDTDCDDDGVPDGLEVLGCMLLADCDGDGAEDRFEANKACVQNPECVPLGMSTEEHEVGLMIDFGELVR